MDGAQGVGAQFATSGRTLSDAAWRPTVVDLAKTILSSIEGLSARRIDDLDALVITKTLPGFDQPAVDALRQLVAEAAAGRLGVLKFLVVDFAHDGFPLSIAADGFTDLVAEIETLILAAPIVSIACARANLAGADLEFALACSMTVGEADKRFSFAADIAVSVGTYGLLAQKIGFVRAERLMETGEIISAARMDELMLLKEVLEAGGGDDGLDAFVGRITRRYNASYGIYRAQRMAMPPVHRSLRA
jgi:enoyl-CoA hydratase/carnithine racemase